MKKYFNFQFLFLLFLASSLTAQNKYYEISFVELIPPDDNKIKEYLKDAELLAEFQNVIVANNNFILTFEGSGKYRDFEIEDFIFYSVSIFDSKSLRLFEKLNLSTNPPFVEKGVRILNKEKLLIGATGKTKVINSKLCHEYKLEYPIEATYYVDKTLPFINYENFPISFPGFVSSYTTNKYGINSTVVVQLEEIKEEEKYFKYISEFKKQFPSLASVNEENYTNNNKIPKHIIISTNEEFLKTNYYRKSMQEFQDIQNLSIKNKVVYSDKSNWEAYYYDPQHREIFKLYNVNNSLEKDLTPTPELIGDSVFIEYRKDGSLSTKLSSHQTSQTYEYHFISLGTKLVFYLNESGNLKSKFYYNEKDILRSETTYLYNQKQQLITTKINELSKKRTREYNYKYHPNGLLEEMIKNGDTTNLKYIFKPGTKVDTLYIKEKKSNENYLRHKRLHFDKNGLLLLTNDSGEYSARNKYHYNYFDSQEQKPFSELENKLRIEYLNSFYKSDSILMKIRNPKDKQMEFDKLCKHTFASIEFKKTDNRNSILHHLDCIPDLELLEIEVIHDDQHFEYYKAYYKETLYGHIDIKRGDYNQIIQYLQSNYGKNTIKTKPQEWTFKLEIDTRYVIIKKDKSNNQWLINL